MKELPLNCNVKTQPITKPLFGSHILKLDIFNTNKKQTRKIKNNN